MRRHFTALCLAAALFAQAPALAGDFTTQVTAVPDAVTRSSSAQQTFADYQVVISNTKPNAINGVRLTGTTSVSGASLTAPFVSSSGLACTTNAALTSIDCPIASIAAGASVTFKLTFATPTNGTRIDFAWKSFFDSSGAGGSDGSGGTAATALNAPSNDAVTSAVPDGGGTFFTGVDGVARAGDRQTTTVKVPTAAVASVVESISQESCSPDLLDCFVSDINIPGQFSQLEFTLRLDASAFRKGAKIANARIFYTPTGGTAVSEVFSCSVTQGPAPGVPCIQSRIAYTKKNAPTPDFAGDWEFLIFAVDNGRFRY